MISWDGVYKAFGANQVLRGFSLDVHEGETMVIIGYSGSGKSVAIKHVVGLLEPDAGTVVVDDHDVPSLSRRDLYQLRAHIGYVFQFAALFDSLTIGENVAMGLRKQGKLSETEMAKRVDETLDLVTFPLSPTGIRPSCREACESASASPARSPCVPSTSSTTSPRRVSIPSPAR